MGVRRCGEPILPLSRIKDLGVDKAKEGSEKTVVVEIKNGEEEVVEVCPVEVYQIKEEKKTRKPRQKKEDKVEVTEEAPDPEFEGVPGEEVIEAQVTEREIIEEKVEETVKNEQDIPEQEISLPEVKEALKEYGLWVVEQGNESHSAKEYLVALLRKYGKVEASKDLDAEGRNAVFNAAVDRVPMEELEGFK